MILSRRLGGMVSRILSSNRPERKAVMVASIALAARRIREALTVISVTSCRRSGIRCP